MRRYQSKRGPLVLGGPQPVKVLRPEILFLTERAEGIFNTVGHVLRGVAASGVGAPGVEGRFELDQGVEGANVWE